MRDAEIETLRQQVFQSAPGREAGRCAGALSAATALTVVSIRARP